MILENISSRDLLIDAYKFKLRGDARAHEAITIIKNRNDMENAVKGCLEKAKREEDPRQQQFYCRASMFGKQFHPGVAIDDYQLVCKQLRIVNSCRSEIIAPSDDIQQNVEQCMDFKKYDLARWIKRYLKQEDKDVLMRWCEESVRNRSVTDEQLAKKFQQIIGTEHAISYADIAAKAIEFNRASLAISLLENESQASKKIHLLLSMSQYDLVLEQAIATCDSNTIYSAIFKLKDLIGSEVRFIELIKRNVEAFKYYSNFLAIADSKKLIQTLRADEGKEDLSLYIRDGSLDLALGLSKKMKQEFSTNQIELWIRFNRFQQTLKQIEPPPLSQSKEWYSLSISDTIINLIALGHVNKAKDCQRKFDVSDKKYRILEQIALKCLPKFELPSASN